MTACSPQRTVAAGTESFTGVGLHSGRAITLRLLPALAGSGVTFLRTDLDGAEIALCSDNVGDTMLATTLVNGKCQIATIEHLLSVLCAFGIDNLRIELDGPEVPSMDGSAMPFAVMIRDCGMVEQDMEREFWRILKTVEVDLDGGRTARFDPHPLPRWEVAIDFSHPVIRRTPQRCVFELSDNAAFLSNISRARTFGFKSEFDSLLEHDRALGASLMNSVVLERTKVLNDGGLRQADEFAAHKLLDAIGDCYVEGRLVIGSYVATRPGHELNHELMKKLRSSEDCFERVTAAQLDRLPDFGPLCAPPLY